MKRMVIDGHSDAILPVLGRSLIPGETDPRDFFASPEGEERLRAGAKRSAAPEARRGHIDLGRLVEGGVAVQSMALFLDDEYLALGPRSQTFVMLEALEGLYEGSGGRFFPYREPGDALRAHAEGKVAGLFAIEGGEALEGNLDELRDFALRGLKMLGLTWNRGNELGQGVLAEGRGGLTAFGRKAVAECERSGILVDASHLSDEAFDDLSACAERPFVASHSSCRAVCGNRRNLDDARIEALAGSGGLIALNLFSLFISDGPGGASLERILRQVDHAVSVAGIEHVGFGSDFDGYPPSEGDFMEGAQSWPALAEALSGHGYAEDEVDALLGGNWYRVLTELD
jgi:membrane dipeptidase